jgi:hypothetical protein
MVRHVKAVLLSGILFLSQHLPPAFGSQEPGPGRALPISIYAGGDRYLSFSDYTAKLTAHDTSKTVLNSRDKAFFDALTFRSAVPLQDSALCWTMNCMRGAAQGHREGVPVMIQAGGLNSGNKPSGEADPQGREVQNDPLQKACLAIHRVSVDRPLREALLSFEREPSLDPRAVASTEELEQKIDELMAHASGPLLMVAQGRRVRFLKIKGGSLP